MGSLSSVSAGLLLGEVSGGEDNGESEEMANFASITVESNAVETVIAASSSDFSNKVQITEFDTNGDSSGAVPDHTEDHIAISETGSYLIITNLSISNGSNDTVSFAVFKNNGATQLGIRSTRKLGTGGDVGNAGTPPAVNLTAGDTIEAWVQNESSTSNILVEDGSLLIIKI